MSTVFAAPGDFIVANNGVGELQRVTPGGTVTTIASGLHIVSVAVEPESVIVGGNLIPVDTTSLILAGTQMDAAWMIPVIISAIGIGIVIARKF